MSDYITMKARDTISGKLARCYVTIGNERYNFCNAINLEAHIKKKKSLVPILGRTGSGNRSNGWEGRGKATFHYNMSIFRKLLLKYKESGEDIYFDMQIVNEDPTSAVGRQTVTLLGCNINGGTLAKFDASADYLDEELEFTFEDFSIPEEFRLLNEFTM